MAEQTVKGLAEALAGEVLGEYSNDGGDEWVEFRSLALLQTTVSDVVLETAQSVVGGLAALAITAAEARAGKTLLRVYVERMEGAVEVLAALTGQRGRDNRGFVNVEFPDEHTGALVRMAREAL